MAEKVSISNLNSKGRLLAGSAVIAGALIGELVWSTGCAFRRHIGAKPTLAGRFGLRTLQLAAGIRAFLKTLSYGFSINGCKTTEEIIDTFFDIVDGEESTDADKLIDSYCKEDIKAIKTFFNKIKDEIVDNEESDVMDAVGINDKTDGNNVFYKTADGSVHRINIG